MKHLYNRVLFWKNTLMANRKKLPYFCGIFGKANAGWVVSVTLPKDIWSRRWLTKLNLIQLCQLSNQHYFKHKYNYISGWQWTFKNRNNITIFLFEPNKIFNTNFSNYCTILWFGPINKHIDRFPHHSLAPAINCKNDHFDAV